MVACPGYEILVPCEFTSCFLNREKIVKVIYSRLWGLVIVEVAPKNVFRVSGQTVG